MALNYGLGEDFTTLVPVSSGMCKFSGINHNMARELPPSSGQSKVFQSAGLLGPESVIFIGTHTFKKALPEDDNGDLEYFLTLFSSSDGTSSDTKVAEYRPKLAKGTNYSYVIDLRARVGDFVSQKELDGSSVFAFSVRRKKDNKQPSLGFAGNTVTYVILSPITLIA